MWRRWKEEENFLILLAYRHGDVMKKFNPNVAASIVRHLREVLCLVSLYFFFCFWSVRVSKPIPLLFISCANAASIRYISLKYYVHRSLMIFFSEILSAVKQFHPFYWIYSYIISVLHCFPSSGWTGDWIHIEPCN